MQTEQLQIDDANADRVFRFMAAHCERMRGELGEDYRTGVSSMFFNWRYLCYQLDLERSAAGAAVAWLVTRGLIRVDPMGQYGIHVWLRVPVERAA